MICLALGQAVCLHECRNIAAWGVDKGRQVVENGQDRLAIFIVVAEQSLLRRGIPFLLPFVPPNDAIDSRSNRSLPLKPQKRSNLLEAIAVHGEEDVGPYGCMNIEEPGEKPLFGYPVVSAIPFETFP